jgi:hypothetical protein
MKGCVDGAAEYDHGEYNTGSIKHQYGLVPGDNKCEAKELQQRLCSDGQWLDSSCRTVRDLDDCIFKFDVCKRGCDSLLIGESRLRNMYADWSVAPGGNCTVQNQTQHCHDTDTLSGWEHAQEAVNATEASNLTHTNSTTSNISYRVVENLVFDSPQCVVRCAEACFPEDLTNTICDKGCNNKECNFDGGVCSELGRTLFDEADFRSITNGGEDWRSSLDDFERLCSAHNCEWGYQNGTIFYSNDTPWSDDEDGSGYDSIQFSTTLEACSRADSLRKGTGGFGLQTNWLSTLTTLDHSVRAGLFIDELLDLESKEDDHAAAEEDSRRYAFVTKSLALVAAGVDDLGQALEGYEHNSDQEMAHVNAVVEHLGHEQRQDFQEVMVGFDKTFLSGEITQDLVRDTGAALKRENKQLGHRFERALTDNLDAMETRLNAQISTVGVATQETVTIMGRMLSTQVSLDTDKINKNVNAQFKNTNDVLKDLDQGQAAIYGKVVENGNAIASLQESLQNQNGRLAGKKEELNIHRRQAEDIKQDLQEIRAGAKPHFDKFRGRNAAGFDTNNDGLLDVVEVLDYVLDVVGFDTSNELLAGGARDLFMYCRTGYVDYYSSAPTLHNTTAAIRPYLGVPIDYLVRELKINYEDHFKSRTLFIALGGSTDTSRFTDALDTDADGHVTADELLRKFVQSGLLRDSASFVTPYLEHRAAALDAATHISQIVLDAAKDGGRARRSDSKLICMTMSTPPNEEDGNTLFHEVLVVHSAKLCEETALGMNTVDGIDGITCASAFPVAPSYKECQRISTVLNTLDGVSGVQCSSQAGIWDFYVVGDAQNCESMASAITKEVEASMIPTVTTKKGPTTSSPGKSEDEVSSGSGDFSDFQETDPEDMGTISQILKEQVTSQASKLDAAITQSGSELLAKTTAYCENLLNGANGSLDVIKDATQFKQTVQHYLGTVSWDGLKEKMGSIVANKWASLVNGAVGVFGTARFEDLQKRLSGIFSMVRIVVKAIKAILDCAKGIVAAIVSGGVASLMAIPKCLNAIKATLDAVHAVQQFVKDDVPAIAVDFRDGVRSAEEWVNNLNHKRRRRQDTQLRVNATKPLQPEPPMCAFESPMNCPKATRDLLFVTNELASVGNDTQIFTAINQEDRMSYIDMAMNYTATHYYVVSTGTNGTVVLLNRTEALENGTVPNIYQIPFNDVQASSYVLMIQDALNMEYEHVHKQAQSESILHQTTVEAELTMQFRDGIKKNGRDSNVDAQKLVTLARTWRSTRMNVVKRRAVEELLEMQRMCAANPKLRCLSQIDLGDSYASLNAERLRATLNDMVTSVDDTDMNFAWSENIDATFHVKREDYPDEFEKLNQLNAGPQELQFYVLPPAGKCKYVGAQVLKMKAFLLFPKGKGPSSSRVITVQMKKGSSSQFLKVDGSSVVSYVHKPEPFGFAYRLDTCDQIGSQKPESRLLGLYGGYSIDFQSIQQEFGQDTRLLQEIQGIEIIFTLNFGEIPSAPLSPLYAGGAVGFPHALRQGSGMCHSPHWLPPCSETSCPSGMEVVLDADKYQCLTSNCASAVSIDHCCTVSSTTTRTTETILSSTTTASTTTATSITNTNVMQQGSSADKKGPAFSVALQFCVSLLVVGLIGAVLYKRKVGSGTVPGGGGLLENDHTERLAIHVNPTYDVVDVAKPSGVAAQKVEALEEPVAQYESNGTQALIIEDYTTTIEI